MGVGKIVILGISGLVFIGWVFSTLVSVYSLVLRRVWRLYVA